MATPVSDAFVELAVRTAEQEIWRFVHATGAQAGLDGEGIAKLRVWAGERMRDHSYAAFAAGQPRVMRATFAHAIAHAARYLLTGRPPD